MTVQPWLRKSDVETAVVQWTGMDIDELTSVSHEAHLVRGRFLLWACLRKGCNLSYKSIANWNGISDHRTVMNGVPKANPEEVDAVLVEARKVRDAE